MTRARELELEFLLRIWIYNTLSDVSWDHRGDAGQSRKKQRDTLDASLSLSLSLSCSSVSQHVSHWLNKQEGIAKKSGKCSFQGKGERYI